MGLRDRTLLGVMVYTLERVEGVVDMDLEAHLVGNWR